MFLNHNAKIVTIIIQNKYLVQNMYDFNKR
nr:MAG TPA: hypothetical protein [Caudoviricetes sp.]DAY16076.1 MAG TPA: hypothetical protein [Caudoviricetes sp.]